MDAQELGWWVALRRGERALEVLLCFYEPFQQALSAGNRSVSMDGRSEEEWKQIGRGERILGRFRKSFPAAFGYWVQYLSANSPQMTDHHKELWMEYLAGEEARQNILCQYGDDFDRKDYEAGGEVQHVSQKTSGSLTFRATRRWEEKMPWVAFAELMAAAKVGLVRAIDRFDHTDGHEFAGYAAPVIDTSIKNSTEVTRGHSRELNLAISQVRKALKELELDSSSQEISPDDIDAIAKTTKLDRVKVQDALDALRLDQPAGEWQSGLDEEEISIFGQGVLWQFSGDSNPRAVKDAVADAISQGGLTERELQAVMLFHWEDLNDKEIGARLGTTLGYARVLRCHGMEKAKNWLLVHGLYSTRATSAKQPLLGWPCLSYLTGGEYDVARIATITLESLACLSAPERAAVEGYWRGQTAGQVAAELSETEPQVEQHWRAALQKLSAWFQERKGSFPVAWPILKAEEWVALLESKFRFKPVPNNPKNFDLVEKFEASNVARPGRILLEVIGALGSVPPEDRRLLEQYWAGQFSDGPKGASPKTLQDKLQQLNRARERFAGWLAARFQA